MKPSSRIIIRTPAAVPSNLLPPDLVFDAEEFVLQSAASESADGDYDLLPKVRLPLYLKYL